MKVPSFLAHKRLKSQQSRGFTLIELLVVILIIAILIAIAAPAFLAQQAKAHNSAAQQTVAVVSKNMKAIYASSSDSKYPSASGAILAELREGEPQYTFSEVNSQDIDALLASPSTSTGPENVTFSRDSDDQVTVCVKSKTNYVFCQTRNETGNLANLTTSDDSVAFAASGVQNGGTILNLAGADEHSVRCIAPIGDITARKNLSLTKPLCGDKGVDVAAVELGWTVSDQKGEAVNNNPNNTAAPLVTGDAALGQTLTGTNGIWVKASSYEYQWQRSNGSDWDDVSGATSVTYTVSQDDVAHKIRLRVTANNASNHPVQAFSDETVTVVQPAPTNLTAPVISGTTKVGSTLTATNGTWNNPSANTYTYQWKACDSSGDNCASITDANSQSLTLTAAQNGKTIVVAVTATINGVSATEASVHTSAVAPQYVAPTNSVVPAITGFAKSGQTLTASLGTWNGNPTPTYAYQWKQCASGSCTDISGATSGTFVLTSAQVGKTVKVAVTATNAGGSDIAYSTETATVAAPTSSEIYDMEINADHPAAYYQFNSNLSSSVAGVDPQVANNGAAFSNSSFFPSTGQSGIINGTNQYFATAGSPLQGKNAFTWEGWVYRTSSANWGRIFDYGSGENSDMFLTAPSNAGNLMYVIRHNGAEALIQVAAPPTNGWYHLAVTQTTSNVATIYINGVAKVSGTMPVSPSSITFTKNYLGKSQFAIDAYFGGSYDNVALYTEALSAQRIAAHYNAGR